MKHSTNEATKRIAANVDIEPQCLHSLYADIESIVVQMYPDAETQYSKQIVNAEGKILYTESGVSVLAKLAYASLHEQIEQAQEQAKNIEQERRRIIAMANHIDYSL